jgi:hypothetical protein
MPNLKLLPMHLAAYISSRSEAAAKQASVGAFRVGCLGTAKASDIPGSTGCSRNMHMPMHLAASKQTGEQQPNK